MAWAAQTNIPWAVVGDLWFSPIIGSLVYIIDRGQNFYSFNISTQVYTALANPPFIGTNCYRILHYRNGRLYCIDEGAGAEPWGRRISWYNIATGVWASSSRVGVFPVFDNIWGFCFQDDDTIWAWVKQTGALRFRCVRYVISTDTWTHFANQTGIINIGQARSVIMSAAGTQVYASQMSDAGGPGVSAGRYGIYTIGTDAYTFSGFIVPGPINWAWVDDPIRLWFFEPVPGAPANYTYGYLENDGVTEVHFYWAANAARAVGYGGHFGGSALNAIIEQTAGVNPMTYFDGFLGPTVTTNAATVVIAASATPNGTLDDDGGEACDCGFEWGETVAYGNTTPTESKTTGETFSQVIGGLQPDTTYHFRAFATNSAGTGYGADRSFTTPLVISRAFALAREEL